MNYAFHDIKNIVQPYLDDLPTHSRKRTDHLQHLRAIFLRCRHYKIRLNPHKCVFCVSSSHLLGFVVSKDGIHLDPFQCEIASLQLAVDLLPGTSVEEARFLEIIQLDETRRDAALANEAHKKRVKAHFDKNFKPCDFSEGDLVLLYNQESDKLGAGNPLLHLLQMSNLLESFVGYADGASHSSWNLSSAAWAIFDPSGELVSFKGVCIGWSMNNISEYSALIELLSDAITHGIRRLVIGLDSQLIILQLTDIYSVRNPTIYRMSLRVKILERQFDSIQYQHISRNLNTLTDSLENYVLDRHLQHL
eukprot:PITA_07882